MGACQALALITTSSAAEQSARELFEEASKLVEQGNCPAAAVALHKSYALEPRSATLILLADCRLRESKAATAYWLYSESVGLAKKEGKTGNLDLAKAGAARAAAKARRLRLDLTASTKEAMITLDGKLVDASEATGIMVDPGLHVVAAGAPGHQTWTLVVNLQNQMDTISVPALQKLPPDAARSGAMPPPFAAAPFGGMPLFPPGALEPRARAIRPWVVGTAAAGVVLVTLALGFRIDQLAAADALDDHCGPGRAACPISGYDYRRDRARENLDFGLSVGLGAAGGGALGAAMMGMLLDLRSGSSRSSSARPSVVPWSYPGSGGVVLQGAF